MSGAIPAGAEPIKKPYPIQKQLHSVMNGLTHVLTTCLSEGFCLIAGGTASRLHRRQGTTSARSRQRRCIPSRLPPCSSRSRRRCRRRCNSRALTAAPRMPTTPLCCTGNRSRSASRRRWAPLMHPAQQPPAAAAACAACRRWTCCPSRHTPTQVPHSGAASWLSVPADSAAVNAERLCYYSEACMHVNIVSSSRKGPCCLFQRLSPRTSSAAPQGAAGRGAAAAGLPGLWARAAVIYFHLPAGSHAARRRLHAPAGQRRPLRRKGRRRAADVCGQPIPYGAIAGRLSPLWGAFHTRVLFGGVLPAAAAAVGRHLCAHRPLGAVFSAVFIRCGVLPRQQLPRL